jgi:hypothetical protein
MTAMTRTLFEDQSVMALPRRPRNAQRRTARSAPLPQRTSALNGPGSGRNHVVSAAAKAELKVSPGSNLQSKIMKRALLDIDVLRNPARLPSPSGLKRLTRDLHLRISMAKRRSSSEYPLRPVNTEAHQRPYGALRSHGMKTEEEKFPVADIVNGLRSPIRDLAALRDLREKSVEHLNTLISALGSETSNCVFEVNLKSDQAAKKKIERNKLRSGTEWYSASHIRDYLRFRTKCNSINQMEEIAAGFSKIWRKNGVSIVKIDQKKFLSPNPFGWRMIAIDVRLPKTGLLVEFYMTYGDTILVNDRFLHLVYERWRDEVAEKLTLQQLSDRSIDISLSKNTNTYWFRRSLSMEPLPLKSHRLTEKITEFRQSRSLYDVNFEECASVLKDEFDIEEIFKQ